MGYSQKKTEKIISDIKTLVGSANTKLKPKVLELAKEYEVAINEQNPFLVGKIKRLKEASDQRKNDEKVTPQDIALLLNKIREEHFETLSQSWLYRVLPDKFKHKYKEKEKLINADEISEKNLYVIKDDILRRIRDMDRGLSKDIKIKETKDALEQYANWDCYVAAELAKLAIKMEKEHKEKHDKSICAKVSKHVRTARDGRFATPLMDYEAMIVASNATTSLAHVVEGQWEFKSRWEIEEDEKNCRECLDPIQCRAEKCKHVCHRVVKPMTTKGLKFAINSDSYLKELDNEMKKLMNDDWSDLCPFAKILLKNQRMDKYLKPYDKKKILASHIDKDECPQCESFIDDHPNFFNKE